MTPYMALLRARFRVLLQYRAAALAGFGTQLFWGLIRTMIFLAFYDSSPARQTLNRSEIVTYLWLGQAMLALLPWNIDGDIRSMVRTGTVVYELLRPMDLYWAWYMRAIAQRTAPTILRCVPLFIIAGLFFGMKPPASIAAGLSWVLTTVGALALGCAFTTLLNITLVTTLSGEGIVRFVTPLVSTLSGMLIPISLLPRWTLPAVYALPFCGLVDTPFRAYLGHLPLRELGPALLHQAAWTLAFVVFGRALLTRSIRRMVVQGG